MPARPIRFLTGFPCLLVAAQLSAPAADLPRPPAPPPGQVPDRPEQPSGPALRRLDDREAAGLPPDSQPFVLTLERAYTLALIKARAPKPVWIGPGSRVLDAKSLMEEAKRYRVEDFVRFRKDFLESPPGTFRDPSRSFFDLLVRRRMIDHARSHLMEAKMVFESRSQFVKSEGGSGQEPTERDELAYQNARLGLAERITSYRDALDGFKVELGLTSGTEVIVDRKAIARFETAFDTMNEPFQGPIDDPAVLTARVARLLDFPDLVFGDRSVPVLLSKERELAEKEQAIRDTKGALDAIETTQQDIEALESQIKLLSAEKDADLKSHNKEAIAAGRELVADSQRSLKELKEKRPERERTLATLRREVEALRAELPRKRNDLLRAAEEASTAAGAGRGDAVAAAERGLEARRKARRLIDEVQARDIEVRKLLLALRRINGVLHSVISPPKPYDTHPKNPLDELSDLTALRLERCDSEDRILTLWASYQANRMDFQRLCGSLPQTDWASFLAQFSSPPGAVPDKEPEVERAPLLPPPPR